METVRRAIGPVEWGAATLVVVLLVCYVAPRSWLTAKPGPPKARVAITPPAGLEGLSGTRRRGVTGPCILMTINRIVEEKAGRIRFDVYLVPSGGLEPVLVDAWAFSALMFVTRLWTETGEAVAVRMMGMPDFVTDSRRIDYVPLPQEGLQMALSIPEECALVVLTSSGEKLRRLRARTRLDYWVECPLPLLCPSVASRRLIEVPAHGAGSVVFERLPEPGETVWSILYPACLVYWLGAVVLLRRFCTGPDPRGLAGKSYILALGAAGTSAAVRYIPPAVGAEWFPPAGWPVPVVWIVLRPLLLALAISVLGVYAYQGGLVVCTFPPMLLTVGARRASDLAAKLWRASHEPLLRAAFVAACFLVFQLLMWPRGIAEPILYAVCLAYWVAGIALLKRLYEGPELRGFAGTSYTPVLAAALLLVAFGYVPRALSLNWSLGGRDVPLLCYAAPYLLVPLVVSVLAIHAYKGGLVVWVFPPLLMAVGAGRALGFVPKVWKVCQGTFVRMSLLVACLLLWARVLFVLAALHAVAT